jgi:hypothetical protein
MPGKPYQSCLSPHGDEIIVLRRRRPPMPYSQIASLLREKYQIVVRREAIYSFIKIRAKQGSKTCKYAWSVEPSDASNKPTMVTPSLQNPAALPKPPVSDKPKQTGEHKPKTFNMPFSETYNLTRLTPEELATRRKKLEEKEKQ